MAVTGKKMTRRNVTLVEDESDGITSYKLLDAQGVIPAFTTFARSLAASPFNTRRTYCHAIADFLDYFYEAASYLAAINNGKTGLTRIELQKIVNCWDDYLIVGEKSGMDLARAICTTLPSPCVSKSTAAVKNAALISFLTLSDDLSEETAELVSLQLLPSKIYVDPQPLFATAKKALKISIYERRAITRNSLLAGVMAGGASSKKKRQRKGNSVPNQFDMSRVFPFELMMPFIEGARSHRDKAFYALCAASGCRAHEGLQILWDDIDVTARTVKLINPFNRWNIFSYQTLTARERDKLAWKGRETDLAFLIEPFASKFFQYLEDYLREEYYPHGQHDFVFQCSKGNSRGRPYFLTAQQTRQEAFNSVAAKVGLTTNIDGVHSFRHAYGTYLLNYLPLGNGSYGLPLGKVKVMMGHADLRSTQKYAVHDKDLIEAQLAYANSMVFGGASPKTVSELRVEALRAELVRYERYLNDNKVSEMTRLEFL